MVGLFSGDDGSEGCEGEVDTGEWHQVGLELVQVDVQGTVESQGSGDGGDNLGDKTVEVSEARRSDSQVLLADIIDSLIIDHERTIGVLKGGVGGQHCIVRLDDGVSEPGGGIDGEL